MDALTARSPARSAGPGAFPGIRQLALLQALGDQGIVGSICPGQVNDPTLSDFGYRPVIQGLVERLKARSSVAP